MEWCRTIHSACYHAAGLKRHDVFGKEDDKLLAKQGFPIVGERSYGALWGDGAFQEGYDAVLFAISLARNTRRPLSEIVEELQREYDRIRPSTVKRVKKVYQQLKKSRAKHDFDDMLEMIVEHDQPIDIDVLFLDESQDFTRLQWEAVHVLARKAKRVYMAGDDDQSIYAFLGADEYGFLDHPCDEEVVLDISHRCPVRIGRYAERVIKKVDRRREKHVRWQQRPGGVDIVRHISERDVLASADAGQDAMFLLRHRAGAKQWSDFLLRHGIPHWLRGEALNCTPLARAVKTYALLRKGQRMSKGEVCNMLQVLQDRGNANALRMEGDILELGRDELEYIMTFNKPWTKLFMTRNNRREIEGLNAILRRANTYEIIGSPPTVKISTMHASKGEEADAVFIGSDCNARAHDSARRRVPSEIRLAYVALTRARERVMIGRPENENYLSTLF